MTIVTKGNNFIITPGGDQFHKIFVFGEVIMKNNTSGALLVNLIRIIILTFFTNKLPEDKKCYFTEKTSISPDKSTYSVSLLEPTIFREIISLVRVNFRRTFLSF